MDRKDGEILQRITHSMAKQKKKHKDLIAYLGLTKGTYSNWLRKQSISFLCYLEEIAKYLNVSVNYLVTGNEYANQPSLSKESEEKTLSEKIHELSSENRKYILDIVDILLKEQGK